MVNDKILKYKNEDFKMENKLLNKNPFDLELDWFNLIKHNMAINEDMDRFIFIQTKYEVSKIDIAKMLIDLIDVLGIKSPLKNKLKMMMPLIDDDFLRFLLKIGFFMVQ